MKEKEKNREKVIRYVMKNPTATINAISSAVDVPWTSVQRYLKEYRESDNKDPRIVSITNKDLDIVRKWQEIIEAKLNDEEQLKKMSAAQVSQVTSESVKRYSLLRWVQNSEQQGNVNNQAIQVNILFGWQEEWATP